MSSDPAYRDKMDRLAVDQALADSGSKHTSA